MSAPCVSYASSLSALIVKSIMLIVIALAPLWMSASTKNATEYFTLAS